MFPKPPRPEPPRRAIATQVVQQRQSGALDTSRIIVEKPVPPGAPVAKPGK